jgi:hypothetical protein
VSTTPEASKSLRTIKGAVSMGVVDDEMDAMGRPYRASPLVRFGAIGEGWGLLMRRWPTWVLTALVVLACNSVLSGLVFSFFGVKRIGGPGAFWVGLSSEGRALQVVLSTAVNGLFLGGMYRMACRQIRGRPFGVATLFSVTDQLPQLVVGSVLYGVATFVGFCMLVVPGFIVSGVLMFLFPLIVDGGLTAPEALLQSWHALKREWLVATVFHLVAGFVAWMGLCLCGVGFLITAPLYCLSIAVLYRDFFMLQASPE